MTSSSQRPAIGILAETLRLGELHAALEASHEAWEKCWVEDTHEGMSEFQRHRLRRLRAQRESHGEALEIAAEEADLAFSDALAAMLERRVLTRGLAAAVAHGDLPEARAEYILAAAADMSTSGYREGETPADDEEGLWIAVPFTSARWENALKTQPRGWEKHLERALREALKDPSVEVLGSAAPIHPMTWASTSVDDRYALFQASGATDAPGLKDVWATWHETDAEWRLKAQTPEWRMVDTPIRLWPVWIQCRLGGSMVQQLEPHILELGALPRWERVVKPWVDGEEEGVSLPLPIDDALSHTFLLQTRYLQLADAVATGRNDHVPDLVDLKPDLDEAGQRWVQLDLEYPNGESIELRLPMAWSGLTPFQRTETLALCQEAWGCGAPRDDDEALDEEDGNSVGGVIFEGRLEPLA